MHLCCWLSKVWYLMPKSNTLCCWRCNTKCALEDLDVILVTHESNNLPPPENICFDFKYTKWDEPLWAPYAKRCDYGIQCVKFHLLPDLTPFATWFYEENPCRWYCTPEVVCDDGKTFRYVPWFLLSIPSYNCQYCFNEGCVCGLDCQRYIIWCWDGLSCWGWNTKCDLEDLNYLLLIHESYTTFLQHSTSISMSTIPNWWNNYALPEVGEEHLGSSV